MRAPGLGFDGQYPIVQDPSTFPIAGSYLEPASDLPPATVITRVRRASDGSLHVRGTTSSNGTIKAVRINGHPARPLASDLSEWEVVLAGDIAGGKLAAAAETETGVNEARPHELSIADGTASRGDVPRD